MNGLGLVWQVDNFLDFCQFLFFFIVIGEMRSLGIKQFFFRKIGWGWGWVRDRGKFLFQGQWKGEVWFRFFVSIKGCFEKRDERFDFGWVFLIVIEMD